MKERTVWCKECMVAIRKEFDFNYKGDIAISCQYKVGNRCKYD